MPAIILDRTVDETTSAMDFPGCCFCAWYATDMRHSTANTKFRVIDLFAGPGGLAEGFSSCDHGAGRFDIKLSVEKEASAFATLRLRSFYRNLRDPADYFSYANGRLSLEELKARHPDEWNAAVQKTVMLELGRAEDDRLLDRRIDELLTDATDNIVVIGGPPCQAYSLAGRSRNAGNKDYIPEKDHRHFLFREYIRILDKVRPRVFVMENVKGILSSRVAGKKVFDLVLEDLRNAAGPKSYRLFSLSPEQDGRRSDYVLRAEEHGVPQKRHRVILVGVRSEIAEGLEPDALRLPRVERPVTVRDAIGDLPRLRSGLSKGLDCFDRWRECVATAFAEAARAMGDEDGSLRTRLLQHSGVLSSIPELRRRDDGYGDSACSPYAQSLRSSKLSGPLNHETRGHMVSDLARYAFCATFAELYRVSPSSRDFPQALAPQHANWSTGKFADRFRAQVASVPSTTITSHISKDGHYFIHPDPLQCRSLTVREAARLQSFPDDYIFLGNRTAQYVQVGNAVPPMLAKLIAEALSDALTGQPAKKPELVAG